MTSTGRTVIAIVALVIGGVLVIVGTLGTHGDGAVAAGSSMIALITGYVFGDRNGEKRLASALTVMAADKLTATAPEATP